MPVIKKTKTGTVVSNKMTKTAVVEVSRQIKHPHFKKYYIKRKKFKAHDENNECQIGDTVLMRECAPISRDKKWVITKILTKSNEGMNAL